MKSGVNIVVFLILRRGYLYFPAPGPGPKFLFTNAGPQFVFTGPGPGPKFVFIDPGSQFVFTGHGPQCVLTDPGKK